MSPCQKVGTPGSEFDAHSSLWLPRKFSITLYSNLSGVVSYSVIIITTDNKCVLNICLEVKIYQNIARQKKIKTADSGTLDMA